MVLIKSINVHYNSMRIKMQVALIFALYPFHRIVAVADEKNFDSVHRVYLLKACRRVFAIL